MLYFQEHEWMPVPGATRFSAWIRPQDQSPDDIYWSLYLSYMARGPQWLRVKGPERPSLYLNVAGFHPRLRHWTDLQQANFWELPGDDLDWPPGGSLYVDYSSCDGAEDDDLTINDHLWRVAGRDGRFFTVEMAAFADARELSAGIPPTPVLPDGTPDESAAAEFWKQNAQLYLIEQVPFGTVIVQVPRNARDLEAYAMSRAHALLGLERPEHIDLRDHSRRRDATENIARDIFVHLHFNGYYQH